MVPRAQPTSHHKWLLDLHIPVIRILQVAVICGAGQIMWSGSYSGYNDNPNRNNNHRQFAGQFWPITAQETVPHNLPPSKFCWPWFCMANILCNRISHHVVCLVMSQLFWNQIILLRDKQSDQQYICICGYWHWKARLTVTVTAFLVMLQTLLHENILKWCGNSSSGLGNCFADFVKVVGAEQLS